MERSESRSCLLHAHTQHHVYELCLQFWCSTIIDTNLLQCFSLSVDIQFFSYLPFYILKQQHVSIVCNFTRVLLTGTYKLMQHCCQYFLLPKLLIFVVYHSHSISLSHAHTHTLACVLNAYLSLSFARTVMSPKLFHVHIFILACSNPLCFSTIILNHSKFMLVPNIQQIIKRQKCECQWQWQWQWQWQQQQLGCHA